MALVKTSSTRIAGICSCVPKRRFDNVADTVEFSAQEVRKVTGMAGVAARRLAGESVCSSDLCALAAEKILARLGWAPDSIDALVMVTQSPDYFLPATACVVHGRLGLSDRCVAFDVGLGCSGYPYGLWLASMMLQGGGIRRALVLHGETPSRFADKADRSVSLLFGDAGSATALEGSQECGNADWYYALHSDGGSYRSMIIESGGFRDRFGVDPRKHCVTMDGALIFNFTIRCVPSLIEETLSIAGKSAQEIDYFVFHQSNQYIIKHLCAKQSLPLEKVPIILKEFGNTGGASIPLTLTEGGLIRPEDRALKLLLLGYGVGLSWGSALVELDPQAVLESIELDNVQSVSAGECPTQ
ncbi:MAG: ketoacyl-ACP synthase III [Bryobacteraceae bacterium]